MQYKIRAVLSAMNEVIQRHYKHLQMSVPLIIHLSLSVSFHHGDAEKLIQVKESLQT